MTTRSHAASALASTLVVSMAMVAHAQTVEGPAEGVPAATAAHRKAEHERIRHEREALAVQRQRDEAACYQRFSVEECLRGVRAQARDAQVRLRNQEFELNDAERREKAAERLRLIEEKRKAVPGAAASGALPGSVLRYAPAADPRTARAQQEQGAGVRAPQRSRTQASPQDLSQRSADNADRAARARARQAQVLKAAEERRARVEKSQADAAASGRRMAAPLPTTAPALPAP